MYRPVRRWRDSTVFACLAAALVLGGQNVGQACCGQSTKAATAKPTGEAPVPPPSSGCGCCDRGYWSEEDWGEDVVSEADINWSGCCSRRYDPGYRAWYRVGGGYVDVDQVESRGGFSHGGGLFLRLGEMPWYGFSNFTLNHIEGGTQALGTIGLYHPGDGWSCNDWARLSIAILSDHYTDTRFDDLYLSLLRLRLGYALTRGFEFGAEYWQPLQDDEQVTVVVPSGGNVDAAINARKSVGAYLTRRLGLAALSLRLGHAEDPSGVYAGLAMTAAVTADLGVYAHAMYQDGADQSFWAGAAGLEFRFGSGGRRSYCPSAPMASVPRKEAESEDTARGGAILVLFKGLLEAKKTLTEDEIPDYEEFPEPDFWSDPRFFAALDALRIAQGGCNCPPGFVPSTGGMCVNPMTFKSVPCQ